MGAIFPRNEHSVDRVIRVVLGLGLLSLVWIGPQTAWGWVGLVPLDVMARLLAKLHESGAGP